MKQSFPKMVHQACLALMACASMSAAHAGKANDTLVYASDNEVENVSPYHNNMREGVVLANMAWDTLIYRDPKTGEFTPTNPLLGSRTSQTATLLPDGRVLVACGWPSDDSGEVFNPSTGSFNRTTPLVTPRTSCTATLLQDGSVLLDGGIGVYGSTQVAELFKI